MPTALMPSPAIPDLQDTVRRCNRLYWIGARDAARVSPQVAATLFGVTPELAEWLAGATLEAVLDLAEAPVVTFRASLDAPLARAQVPSTLRNLHLALRAAGGAG
jgi:hypothetical protein